MGLHDPARPRPTRTRLLWLALASVVVAAALSGVPAWAANTWEGTWSSTFGEIKMTASGSGTYPNCGTISGGLSDGGTTNKGTWQECSSNGKYEFHMGASGGSFTGSYTRGESDTCVSPPCTWDGTCIAGACLQNGVEDPAPAKGERVTVASISGEVAWRLGAGKWKPLKQGDKLPQNAEIFTGVDSTVTIKTSDGDTLQLDELTQILIDTLERSEDRKEVRIQLAVGKIKALVRGEKTLRANWEIVPPVATAGVRGTVFSVFYDAVAKAAIVTTNKGTVEVNPRAAGLPTKLVTAGKEVEVTKKRISKLTGIGKAGARGGVNRARALELVAARIADGAKGCKLETPRSAKVFSVKPAPRGWLVTVTVRGKVDGKSKWTVKRGKARPKNRLARRIARGCS